MVSRNIERRYRPNLGADKQGRYCPMAWNSEDIDPDWTRRPKRHWSLFVAVVVGITGVTSWIVTAVAG
jgi:hypothetical protein